MKKNNESDNQNTESIAKDVRIIQKEINEAVGALNLNLAGLTILTEAASNIFVVAPLIALAGQAKKVYALCQSSQYGKFKTIAKNTYRMAQKMGLEIPRLSVITKNKFKAHKEINIITNLGHVRPLDKKVLPLFQRGTVISYMCEDWEYRRHDLDLKLCQKYNLPVFGINEEHAQVNCFREAGLIPLKLIFESKISLFDARIAIISRDKFGQKISDSLKHFTKNIILLNNFNQKFLNQLDNLDLLIVAEYLYPKTIIGSRGIIRPKILKQKSPYLKIIQFCGHNNLKDIQKTGISVYPNLELGPQRMFQTLGDISYKSVIRLYTAGLKVGEIGFRKDFDNQKYQSLIQPMK